MNWGTLSRAARDAAYDNIAAVTDSMALNTARAEASAVFRAGHAGHLDLRYGPRERNTWDLFPAADPNAPCVVFIHGGYWQRNSKDQFASLIAGPYALGWSAALPGHTLAPDASLTEIVAEINAALDWLAANRNDARDPWSGRAVRLVGGRASDGALPRTSADPGGPCHFRHF